MFVIPLELPLGWTVKRLRHLRIFVPAICIRKVDQLHISFGHTVHLQHQQDGPLFIFRRSEAEHVQNMVRMFLGEML
jgi:hypothetical protein